MVGSLLLRGMLVGLLAGLLAFAFAKVVGEPPLSRAIAYEEQRTTAHEMPGMAEPEEPELVSREVQSGPGLFTGTVVFGAALGGLFALVCAACLGRFGALGARGTAALVAAGGYVALVLVPTIKYPANPPAANLAETIGLRTELFFVLLLVSAVVLGLCAGLWRGLSARGDGWRAALLAGAAYVAVMAVALTILPGVDEVPGDFSADTLWRFRLASLGTHLILWTTLGLGFGVLAERVVHRFERTRSPDRLAWGG